MKQGGNAIDASLLALCFLMIGIAVAFCLDTVNMFATTIGSGGGMLISFGNGSSTFLDFREVAPAVMDKDFYGNDSYAKRHSILVCLAYGSCDFCWCLW